MKRRNKIFVLAGILLVLCLATFGIYHMEQKKEDIKISGETILDIPADTITSIGWELESSQPLSFHRDGENWIYDDDPAFPVSTEKLESILLEFSPLSASFTIENVEDLGQYGLDRPSLTIHLGTADQSYEILLGDYSTMDEQRYLSLDDGNVYLAANDPTTALYANLSDLIAHDTVPDFEQVQSIRFTGAESYEITFQEEGGPSYRKDDHWFTQKDGSLQPLDPDRVEQYLQDISDLYLTTFATYNASEEELASFGLQEPELIVEIDYTASDENGEATSETFTLSVARDPEEQEVDDSAMEEITAYIRIGESSIVYEINGYSYTPLMLYEYNDLRYHQILPAEFSDVTSLNVSLDGQQYLFTARTESNDVVWSYNDEDLDSTDLEQTITNLSASEFTSEPPAGPLEVSFTAEIDADSAKTVRVELYRGDGSRCLAVVDGSPYAWVARTEVVDFIEAVNAIVLGSETA